VRTEASFSLRPVTAEDRPFLLRLYAGTRAEELAQTGWSEEQKAAFIRMQFEAQDIDYRRNYDPSTFYLIESAGEPVGRLYLYRTPAEVRVVDIALLPEFRGRGLGTLVLQDVLADADRAGQKVSIHVEIFNRARRLYERLGFNLKKDEGVYLLMER
jgi:GNAT superfamily N-acetyltransferase